MSKYEVGTVLWIIHKDRPGLVAYRVIEEITQKTLDGEKIHYIVQPAAPKAKSVQLESINGRIFLSAEEAKNALVENASRAIDAIVEKTQNLINKVFYNQTLPFKENIKDSQPSESKERELKEGYQWVKMEDGTKVQVKIPEILK